MRVWSLPGGELLQTLSGHEGGVESLAVTPDGALLASGDDKGVVVLWDLFW